jgi:hypothetical protein
MKLKQGDCALRAMLFLVFPGFQTKLIATIASYFCVIRNFYNSGAKLYHVIRIYRLLCLSVLQHSGSGSRKLLALQIGLLTLKVLVINCDNVHNSTVVELPRFRLPSCK